MTNHAFLAVEKLYPQARLPVYATEGSAGADVSACITGVVTLGRREEKGYPFPTHIFAAGAREGAGICSRCHGTKEQHVPAIVIRPGQRISVGTGLRFGIPGGWEMQVRPRSGLALSHGITTCNSPGTVDSDYRGELQVALINMDPKDAYIILDGDRIAQLIVSPCVRAKFHEEIVPVTGRGSAGFGSTGK